MQQRDNRWRRAVTVVSAASHLRAVDGDRRVQIRELQSCAKPRAPPSSVTVQGFPPDLDDVDIESWVKRTLYNITESEPDVVVRGDDLHSLRMQNVFARLYKQDKLAVLDVLKVPGDFSIHSLAQGHDELLKAFCAGLKQEDQDKKKRLIQQLYSVAGENQDKEKLQDMLSAPGGSKYAVAHFRKNEYCKRAVQYSAQHDGIALSLQGTSLSGTLSEPHIKQVKVQVYLDETIESLRPERRPAFDARDLLDQHTLGKVLIFLWRYREELLPETAGEEHHLVCWGNAWRSVLARKLRAEKEAEWVEAFREAFPYNDSRFPPGSKEDPVPCSTYPMQLRGKKSAPHTWLGEPDSEDSSSCSYLEQIMLTEAEKLFVEAGRLLDTSGDKRISRTEFSTFFSSGTPGDGEEQQYVTRFPDKVAKMPYKCEDDKRRRDQTEAARRFSMRMQSIQQQFTEDQCRTCALHMFARQYETLLLELCAGRQTDDKGHEEEQKKEKEAAPRYKQLSLLKSKNEVKSLKKAMSLPLEQAPTQRSPASPGVPADTAIEKCQAEADADPGRNSVRHPTDQPVTGPGTKGKELSEKDEEAAEMRSVFEHLRKGEFHMVHYGLEQIYEDPRESKELLEASRMILTKSSESRLRKKARELTEMASDKDHEAIFQTMIPEDQFLDAYEAATGVRLDDAGVWDKLAAKFGGMIPKETLLKYCRTVPVHGLEYGIGGGVYSSFCSSEHVRSKNSLNFFIFLVFVAFFVATLLPDRGLNVGYYQQLGVNEFLMQELGGSEAADEPSTWYPWTFDDVAEPDEWWEFMNNVLDFVHFGQVYPGVYRNVGLSNNVIGGFKLHQWRVAPKRCSGLDGLLSNNIDQHCDWGAAPIRSKLAQRYPDGTKNVAPAYADCEAGACEYYFIPRNETSYIGSLARDKPTCLKDKFPSSFNRTVRVAVFDWMSARIMVEIFKWLAEEQLGVRVEIVESVPAVALRSLQQPRGEEGIDIILEAWEKLREVDIAKATDAVTGHAVLAGDLGLSGRTGLYVNPSAIEACPTCNRVQAFRNPVNTRKLTCNCSQATALNQGRCAAYACKYECSLCTLSDSVADWCSDCGRSARDPRNLSATCDAAAGCDSRLGALWSIHPSAGLATYGPELFRSKELRLASGTQLVFTRDSAEMIDRVKTASGLNGDGPAVGPMAWFWWEPDPLVAVVKAESVELPVYREMRCPIPEPTVDDPNMTTKYDCAVPDQFLLKLARRDIQRDYPDVFKLLLSFEMEAVDLNEIMYKKSLDKSYAHDEVACSWLKKEENSVKWRHWLQQKPLEHRRTEFHKDCFPAWPGHTWNSGRGNDPMSYTKNSNRLGPVQTHVVNGTRVIKGTGVSIQLPKDPEDFLNLTREARDKGNLSALRNWYRMLPWIYQDCSLPYYGLIDGLVLASPIVKSSVYNCDGYVAFIPLSWTRFRSQQAIQELKDNNWIDLATRAVMMEMFVFSQNTGLIVRVRYLVEISATGGWVRSKRFTVFGLWQSTYDSQVSLAGRFIPTMLTTVYFLCQAVKDLYRSCRKTARDRKFDAAGGHNACCPVLAVSDRHRKLYFYPLKNMFAMVQESLLTRSGDVLDILVYIAVWVAWIFRFHIVRAGVTDVNILCSSQYPNELTDVADLWQHVDQIDAFCAVLVFFRLLYFLRLVTRMEEILETVGRAGPNIFWLLVAFVIMMCGCTLAAWIVFGNLLFNYSGFTRAYTALLFVILGEIHFEELDSHRPTFAFPFFFFFFIVIICILFNLIIAVVGNAYNDVVSERVDVRGFVDRVLHDTDACAWAPLDMGKVSENPGVREVRHLAVRVRLFCCRPSPEEEDPQDQRRRLMRNPRIFWKEYEKVMRDLASGDIITVLLAHAKVRLLMESAHVRQNVAECPYERGDHVYVRDDAADKWRKGIVEAISRSEPLVRPVGWKDHYAWKEVTADRATFRKAPHAEDDTVRVHLLCDLHAQGSFEGPYTIPMSEYPTGTVKQLARIPAGMPPWKQARIGKVVFSPIEGSALPERTVTVPRIAVEPVNREVEREQEEPHDRDEVELLRVSDFLDNEFGKAQRPVIDLFLTQLPAKVLGVNRAGQWVQLLHHYSRWKRVASTYTKFGRTGDDLVAELHQRMLDEMQQQQLMGKKRDSDASDHEGAKAKLQELKRAVSALEGTLETLSASDGDGPAREATRPAAAPACLGGTPPGTPDEQAGGTATPGGQSADGAGAALATAVSSLASLMSSSRRAPVAGTGATQPLGSTGSTAGPPTLPRFLAAPPPLQSTAQRLELQPHAHPLQAPTCPLVRGGAHRRAGSPMRSPETGHGAATPLLAPGGTGRRLR